jgi:hypothetical protein
MYNEDILPQLCACPMLGYKFPPKSIMHTHRLCKIPYVPKHFETYLYCLLILQRKRNQLIKCTTKIPHSQNSSTDSPIGGEIYISYIHKLYIHDRLFFGPSQIHKMFKHVQKQIWKMATEKYLIFMFTLDIVHKIKYLSYVWIYFKCHLHGIIISLREYVLAQNLA